MGEKGTKRRIACRIRHSVRIGSRGPWTQTGRLAGAKAISGDIRPQMVEALRRCKAAFKVACITNNMKTGEGPGMAGSPEKAAEQYG